MDEGEKNAPKAGRRAKGAVPSSAQNQASKPSQRKVRRATRHLRFMRQDRAPTHSPEKNSSNLQALVGDVGSDAGSIPECLGRLQRLSLAAILAARLLGLTAVETALVVGFDRYTIQSRISELRRTGRIVDGGIRRRNPSGRYAIVWIAREEQADA